MLPEPEIDWDAEAAIWGDDTREWAERMYVGALWAEDWDCAEDAVYDDE